MQDNAAPPPAEDSAMPFAIRPTLPGDAPALSGLLGQLGYSVTERQVAQRLALITASGGSVLAAEDASGAIKGCVQAAVDLRLAEGRMAELVSLVVDDSCRGQGLGRLLVDAVAEWARAQGFTALRVRCNVVRDDARSFYQRLGFTALKEQAVLLKPLA